MFELKLCPFCGSKESEWKDHPPNCYLYKIKEQVETGCMAHCKESCEESWNTRPIEDKLQAELEQYQDPLATIPADSHNKIVGNLKDEIQRLKDNFNRYVRWLKSRGIVNEFEYSEGLKHIKESEVNDV